MQLLLDFPTIGEPHYAQALPASLITDQQIRTINLAEEQGSVRDAAEKDEKVER